MVTALRLKATGLKPGVPDIFLPYGGKVMHGLFIEMKHGAGRVSPSQAVWHKNLRAQGYCVEVCWGALEAIDVITRYLEGRFDMSGDTIRVSRSPPK